MFIGHFAVALASKRAAPRVSLGLLVLAAFWLDLLWPFCLALGLESVRIDPGNTAVTPLDLHDYPYTHSLLMALVWSALVALASLAWRRDRAGAWVLGAGVFSHWVLDFVTHRPDLPLYPGSTHYVGLGLWHSKPATALVEVALFLAGLVLYLRTTRPRDWRGRTPFGVLLALLAFIYAGNLLGPPPASADAVAVTAFGLWLFVPWAASVDRHREVRQPAHALPPRE